MSIAKRQNLENQVRANLFFNKIELGEAKNFEIFLNTIVIYGYDHDTRVLEFIRTLTPDQLSKLVMVHLSEDQLSLFWTSDNIPGSLKKGKVIKLKYDDGYMEDWKIRESRLVFDLLRIKDKALLCVGLN
jgi:hypothetical protein